eukprot:COSAG05_NODE_18_length_34957_cov_44.338115_7_plen_342_part_00
MSQHFSECRPDPPVDPCDERPTESIRIPYPHIPLTDAPLVVCRLRKIRWFSSSSLVGVEFTRVASLPPSTHPASLHSSTSRPSGLHPASIHQSRACSVGRLGVHPMTGRVPAAADNNFDAILDGWDAVEAVKVESGEFALDDMSAGPLRKPSWRDEAEVVYYDDGSTNLDSLGASRTTSRRAAPAATHPPEPVHPAEPHPAVHPSVPSSIQPPSSATSPAGVELAQQLGQLGQQLGQQFGQQLGHLLFAVSLHDNRPVRSRRTIQTIVHGHRRPRHAQDLSTQPKFSSNIVSPVGRRVTSRANEQYTTIGGHRALTRRAHTQTPAGTAQCGSDDRARARLQ